MQKMMALGLLLLSALLVSGARADPGWTQRGKIASIETAANANAVWSWIRIVGVSQYNVCKREDEDWQNVWGYALNETIRPSARSEIMTLALAAYLAGKDVQFFVEKNGATDECRILRIRLLD